jgi:hypothetical protein
MESILNVHHPVLTQEERSCRMEKIKKVTVKFLEEVAQHEKQKNQNRMA